MWCYGTQAGNKQVCLQTNAEMYKSALIWLLALLLILWLYSMPYVAFYSPHWRRK